MTQVNLLPREIKQRQEIRRRTLLVAAGGVVVVALLVFLWVLQDMRLSDVNKKLATQNTIDTQLEQQVNSPKLQKSEAKLSEFQARKVLIRQALDGRVAWSGALRDLSDTLPERLWLTSLSGALSSTGAPGTTSTSVLGAAPQIIGNIQFSGDSLDTDTLALLLTRLEEVHGWRNSWLSSAQQVQIGTTTVYSFSGSVDLTQNAALKGGQQ